MKNSDEPINPVTKTYPYGQASENYLGLTKREYVSIKAMQGILSDGETKDIPAIAKASIMIADELLKQLNP